MSDIKIVRNEAGGIGFSFPSASESPIPYEWGKTTLFNSPMLKTGKYNGVAVGGKCHALLKLLSEHPGEWLDKHQLKAGMFTPTQAWTVANLSREGVKKLVSSKTYVAETIKSLKFAGCARVRGNKRNYTAKITDMGIEVLGIIEEKHGPTRGAQNEL